MNTLVELVKLGFLGFAVALMWLAYRSLSGAIAADKLSSDQLKIISSTTKTFIFCSVAVIGIGLVFVLLDPRIRLYVSVIPDDMPSDLYAIKYEEKPVNFANGNEIEVRGYRTIRVDLVKLDRMIKGAKQQLASRGEVQKERLIERAKDGDFASESGF